MGVSQLRHLGADVDADPDRWPQRREQVTGAGADFEDARSGRDLEAGDLLDQAVVRAVAPSPPRLDGREPVEERGASYASRPSSRSSLLGALALITGQT